MNNQEIITQKQNVLAAKNNLTDQQRLAIHAACNQLNRDVRAEQWIQVTNLLAALLAVLPGP